MFGNRVNKITLKFRKKLVCLYTVNSLEYKSFLITKWNQTCTWFVYVLDFINESKLLL